MFTDPAELFYAANDAIRAEQWSMLPGYCDPVSLRSFQRNQLQMYAPENEGTPMSAEQYVKLVPGTPLAVAEHLMAQAQASRPASRIAEEMPGLTTVEEVRALSTDELFAKWLEGRSMRNHVTKGVAAGRFPARALEAIASFAANTTRFTVLGVVVDTEGLAYVLYGNEIDKDQPWHGDGATWLAALPQDEQALQRQLWDRAHPQVALCRRQNDNTWRLLADHNFLNIGAVHIGSMSFSDEASRDVSP